VFSEFENINRSAFTEFMPFFKQADLVLGNLEGAITEYNQPRKPYVPGKSYSFRFPPSTANLLKQANFHVISIANNHVHDFGPIGFSDTQRYLSQVGIETTGLKSSYIIRTVKGKRIAVISLAYYPVFNNVLEIDEAANLVKEVRAKSDIVVLYYQMGAEGDSAIKISADNEIFLGEKFIVKSGSIPYNLVNDTKLNPFIFSKNKKSAKLFSLTDLFASQFIVSIGDNKGTIELCMPFVFSTIAIFFFGIFK
jgi:hypothetical protein